MQGEWLPLKDVVARIVRATDDDINFVCDELIRLLRAGAISGRSAYSLNIIPACDWNDVALSKTGTAIVPGIVPGRALPSLTRQPIELRLPDVLLNWAEQAGDILCPQTGAETDAPADILMSEPNTSEKPKTVSPEPEGRVSADVTHKTGRPGKPSSWPLVEQEFYRRYATGKRHDGNLSTWGRELGGWLQGAHPSKPKMGPKRIRDRLSETLPAHIRADL